MSDLHDKSIQAFEAIVGKSFESINPKLKIQILHANESTSKLKEIVLDNQAILEKDNATSFTGVNIQKDDGKYWLRIGGDRFNLKSLNLKDNLIILSSINPLNGEEIIFQECY